MDERLLNRAFNEAVAADQAQQAAKRRKGRKENGQKDDVPDSDAPMQASDAIQRILSAKKEKDWFRCCPHSSCMTLQSTASAKPCLSFRFLQRSCLMLQHPCTTTHHGEQRPNEWQRNA